MPCGSSSDVMDGSVIFSMQCQSALQGHPLVTPFQKAIALYTLKASASECTPEPRDILGAVVSPATAYRLTLGAGSAAMASWIVEYDSGMPPACATHSPLLPGYLT